MGIRGDMRSTIQTINLHSTPRNEAAHSLFSIAEWFGRPLARSTYLPADLPGMRGGGGGLVGFGKTLNIGL